jgi:aryl-alcohol dehydrogenase-like predicted oxidoreductase
VEREVFAACREFGLGNVVWSPLAQGILTGKYTSARAVPKDTRAASNAAGMMSDYFTQPVLDAVQQLKPLAAKAGCTLGQLALAWCLRDEIVSAVIVGATRPEQVDENVAAADLSIDPEIFREMDRIVAPVAPG